MINRKFGAIRDVHDVRDRLYRAAMPLPALPPQVFLTSWAGPIKDQGEEGSCTGHAFSSGREWIARRYEKSSPVLSPQSLYVEELIAEGSYPEDAGAMPRTGCQVLAAKGCCDAALYPYIQGSLTVPTPEQAQNALKYRIGAYHRIATLEDFLTCLADPTPWPVMVGFTVPESFMSQRVADTGIMPEPKPGERSRGGHEVLCLGYDLTKGLALIQNSWGDAWGQKGYFWMPFSVIASPDTDLWMVHTGGPWASHPHVAAEAPVSMMQEIEEIEQGQGRIEKSLHNLSFQVGDVQNRLEQILRVLIPPLPVKFGVTLTTMTKIPTEPTEFAVTETKQGEKIMNKVKKAGVDFQLLDNGTAKATATPQDAAGLATSLPAGSGTPSWTSSDPAVVVAADPSDASGLTAIVSPAQPPKLVTGVIVTVSCTLADATVITGAGDPIDVVAGGASGFQVVEQ